MRLGVYVGMGVATYAPMMPSMCVCVYVRKCLAVHVGMC